jgi:hypothetical protein
MQGHWAMENTVTTSATSPRVRTTPPFGPATDPRLMARSATPRTTSPASAETRTCPTLNATRAGDPERPPKPFTRHDHRNSRRSDRQMDLAAALTPRLTLEVRSVDSRFLSTIRDSPDRVTVAGVERFNRSPGGPGPGDLTVLGSRPCSSTQPPDLTWRLLVPLQPEPAGPTRRAAPSGMTCPCCCVARALGPLPS